MKKIFLSILLCSAGYTIPFQELTPLKGKISFAEAKLMDDYILSKIRFFGNHSEEKGNFEKHNKTNLYPQDAIACLLQHLYPSIDGANFTFNNYENDPFGELARNPEIGRAVLFEIIQKIICKEKCIDSKTLHCVLDNFKDVNYDAKKLNQLKQKQSQPEELKNLEKCQKEHDLFEGAQVIKKKIDFILSVINPALEMEMHNQHYLYSQDQGFVSNMLLAYMLRFTNSKKELALFEPLFDKNAFESFLKEKPFSAEDYDKQKEAFLENIQNKTAEDIMLFYEGYENFISIIPDPIIMKGHVLFKGNAKKDYPDCGETMILNFIRTIFKKNDGVDIEKINNLFPNSPLYHYYNADITRSSLAFCQTDDGHNTWGDLIASLKGNIKYCRGNNEYELNAGLFNFMEALGMLLNDEDLLWHDEEKRLENAQEKLSKWCEKFSNLSCYFSGDNETSMKIHFSINWGSKFNLSFMSCHFQFEKENESSSNWITKIREKTLPENIKNNQILRQIFNNHQNSEEISDIWGPLFGENDLNVIVKIYEEKQEKNLITIAKNLIKTIPWKNDSYSLYKLANIMKNNISFLEKVFSREDIIEFFSLMMEKSYKEDFFSKYLSYLSNDDLEKYLNYCYEKKLEKALCFFYLFKKEEVIQFAQELKQNECKKECFCSINEMLEAIQKNSLLKFYEAEGSVSMFVDVLMSNNFLTKEEKKKILEEKISEQTIFDLASGIDLDKSLLSVYHSLGEEETYKIIEKSNNVNYLKEKLSYNLKQIKKDLLYGINLTDIKIKKFCKNLFKPLYFTFEPLNLTLEPLNLTLEPLNLTLESVNLTLEPLNLTVEQIVLPRQEDLPNT